VSVRKSSSEKRTVFECGIGFGLEMQRYFCFEFEKQSVPDSLFGSECLSSRLNEKMTANLYLTVLMRVIDLVRLMS